MALITRISRLFQADVHAVLDRIEEPVAVLRQAVREMEEALRDDERQLKLLVHEAGQLEKRSDDLKESLLQIEDELEICFYHEKDELARTLIRRKLESEQFQKSIIRQLRSLQGATATLHARISDYTGQLESMRQKAELLEDDTGGASDWPSTPDFRVREEDIEVAYLREKAVHEKALHEKPDHEQNQQGGKS